MDNQERDNNQPQEKVPAVKKKPSVPPVTKPVVKEVIEDGFVNIPGTTAYIKK